MTDSAHDKKPPSEELAEIATEALREKKLILDGDAPKIVTEIASGQMKEEDWRLFVEKMIDKEAENE